MTLPSIKVDWTLNVGHFLTAAIIILGGMASWVNLNNKVAAIDERTIYVEKSISRVETNQMLNKVEVRQDLSELRADIFRNEGRRQKEADRVISPPASLTSRPAPKVDINR